MHISETLADMAWERYEEVSARAARYLSGEQMDLFHSFDTCALADEWWGIWRACEAEATRQADWLPPSTRRQLSAQA